MTRRLGGFAASQERRIECWHDTMRPRSSLLMVLRSRHGSRIARIEAVPGKVDVSGRIEFNAGFIGMCALITILSVN